MVMWTFIPARAEYIGTLSRDLDWTLEITNSSNDKCVVTIYYVDRKGVELVEALTLPAAAQAVETLPKPGKDVKYVFIDVHPSLGGRATVSINQSATLNIDVGKRLVLDVF
jgi:hypothetical protein